MTLRRSSLNLEPSIELHIEEVVLHGLPLSRSQGAELRAAVQTELIRLLTEQGLGGSSAVTVPQLSAGSIQLRRSHPPAQLGEQIARAVHRSLIQPPELPRQTPGADFARNPGDPAGVSRRNAAM